MSGDGDFGSVHEPGPLQRVGHPRQAPGPGGNAAEVPVPSRLEFGEVHLAVRTQVVVKEPENALAESVQIVGEDLPAGGGGDGVAPVDGGGEEVVAHGPGLGADFRRVPAQVPEIRRAGGADVVLEGALIALEVEELEDGGRAGAIFRHVEEHVEIEFPAVVHGADDPVLPPERLAAEGVLLFGQEFQFQTVGGGGHDAVEALLELPKDDGALLFPLLQRIRQGGQGIAPDLFFVRIHSAEPLFGPQIESPFPGEHEFVMVRRPGRLAKIFEQFLFPVHEETPVVMLMTA